MAVYRPNLLYRPTPITPCYRKVDSSWIFVFGLQGVIVVAWQAEASIAEAGAGAIATESYGMHVARRRLLSVQWQSILQHGAGAGRVGTVSASTSFPSPGPVPTPPVALLQGLGSHVRGLDDVHEVGRFDALRRRGKERARRWASRMYDDNWICREDAKLSITMS